MMNLPNTEFFNSIAHRIGNASVLSYGVAWALDTLGGFSVQEWITILVGISAIFSYGTAGILNIKKARKMKNEKDENQNNE